METVISFSANANTQQRNLANLVRSDFWFDDGNLLLIAGSATFKVHRGQLQRQSEFFNGLLSLPKPPPQGQENEQLIDGCICVELYDCPSDVLYFLKALYDGLYFEVHSAADFPALAAVLRLSTKYFVEHLRQHCLLRLELDWPATLAGWDQREAMATDDYGRYFPQHTCAHPILVVHLAMEQAVPSVFLAAMYDLSRYGPSKIKIGAQSPRPPNEFLTQDDPEGMVTLSPELLCRALRGRECSQRYMAAFIQNELHLRAPSPGCMNQHEDGGKPCQESFYFIMLAVLRSVGGIAAGRDADPLFTLLQAADMLTRMDGQRQCGLGMCQQCKVDFAATVARAREEVWRMLPRWFGMPDGVM